MKVAVHTPSIAPSYPLPLTEQAAQRSTSYVRATNPGDSDPDPDEALRRVRAGWGICGCGKPDTPGHRCDSLSPAGAAALGRGLVVVDEVQRRREQIIAGQVEAAYAEYADQPKVEYRDWVRTVAA
jgi:hypothetical protein